ncbi:MAG: hypothetical protein M3065_00695, partial [Actinomycetota bacterium]|nr:hypothetical protein [Actinomycetota bacterium]
MFPANAVLRLSDGLAAVGVGSTVTLVDLSGSVHAVVDLPGSMPSWDLSGSHLAWFERPCEEGLFVAADAQAPAAFVAPAPGPCAAPRLTGVSVAPGSRLRLALSCPVAATLGCLASSSVTLHARVKRGISRRLGYWFLDG